MVLFCHFILLISFSPLVRYKKYLLSTWQDAAKRSSIDNLFYPIVLDAWITYEYLRESNPDHREEMKSLVMGGTSGVGWAIHYDNEPFDDGSVVGNFTSQETIPVLSHVDNMCKSEVLDLLIQIGSCSGRKIAYFARKYPELNCIGTDVFPEVVEFSKNRHTLPNLSFELCAAHKLSEVLQSFPQRNILVFSSGSLQYVQPEHMEVFFKAMANSSSRSLKILIGEPADDVEGNPDGLGTSRYHNNMKYTHDYRYYSENAGLKTIKSEVIPSQELELVHYLYIGESCTSSESFGLGVA